MSNAPLQIQCANPTCLHPANSMGQSACDRCQAPLVYRHLWVVGDGVDQIPVNTVVSDRYLVKQPQIWLDLQPGLLPDIPDVLPDPMLPYLHLYPHRLHVPELYGVCQTEVGLAVLLDNVPIDETGQLYATLDSAWTTVSAARQVYWLWQLLQLWQPLNDQAVATSVLISENLRVEGWRVRLQELISDYEPTDEPAEAPVDEAIDTEPPPTMPPTLPPTPPPQPGTSAQPPTLPPRIIEPTIPPTLLRRRLTLRDLAEAWMPLVESSHEAVRASLQTLIQQMQGIEDQETGMKTIATDLNRLLLEHVAQLPMTVEVAGATTTGPQRTQNEDACYPNSLDPRQRRIEAEDFLLPYVAIICDGIGGHEGGEVASQRALEDLKTLTRNLLNESLSQPELMSPEMIMQQLESLVRIVNNVISQQNDDQGRELRQRMGTTLVMALQLPQRVSTLRGPQNAHELYLVTVGDSRAYWLTPRYCHRLTVDDDVATREVRMGRSLYQEALERPDGGALTQAIGTRDADALTPTVQRFVIEESGLLLLCSDGLSDNDRVEQFWQQPTREIFKGKLSLEDGVQSWIQIANERNGHDNTSVVMMRFQVGDTIRLLDPEVKTRPADAPPQEELTEASRALLYDEEMPETPEAAPVGVNEPEPVATSTPAPKPASNVWMVFVGLGLLALIGSAIGLALFTPLGNQTPADSSPGQEQLSPGQAP